MLPEDEREAGDREERGGDADQRRPPAARQAAQRVAAAELDVVSGPCSSARGGGVALASLPPPVVLTRSPRAELEETLAETVGEVGLERESVGVVRVAARASAQASSHWANGTVEPFEGDLDDYRRHLDEERRRAAPKGESAGSASRKDDRRAAAERRRVLEPLRRRLKDAEGRMEKLGREKAAVEKLLADPATYAQGGERTTEALRRQADLARADAEQAWLAAAEALEAASAAS